MGIHPNKEIMDFVELSKEESAALYRTAESIFFLQLFKNTKRLTWVEVSTIVGIKTNRLRNLRFLNEFLSNEEFDKISKLKEQHEELCVDIFTNNLNTNSEL